MDIESAFKLFDIRGHYPGVVDTRLAFLVGKTLAEQYHPKRVLVAIDARESSPVLRDYLIDGLAFSKAEIKDLFKAPVPQFYWTVLKKGFDLGVMVTASHIGPHDNGFKFCHKNGLPFDQKEIIDLKQAVLSKANEPILVPPTEVSRLDTMEEYLADLESRFKGFRLKVVLDLADSVVKEPVLKLFTALKVSFTTINSSSSLSPLLPKAQQALSIAVREQQADLGLLWDSDGDRVVFLDKEGVQIPMTIVLGLFGRSGKGKVIFDVRTGLVGHDLVQKAGNQLTVLPAWGQYIKFAMASDPTIYFGGETSGHFLFSDFYHLDDGLYAALKFMEIWDQPATRELVSGLKKQYFELPEKNLPCESSAAPAILDKLADFYREREYRVSVEDGVTVVGEDFRFNIRQSLTEPLMRLNLEARSQKRADDLIYEIEKHLMV